MSEEIFLNRQKHRGTAEKGVQYTVKDFQLEVLDKLSDMQRLAESLQTQQSELQVRNRSISKIEGKTIVALGAIVLSVAGYVIQDARNSARQDSEIESTKSRVVHLEQIAAANTEGRIRTEVELGELRQGQGEIKAMIQAHDRGGITKKQKNGDHDGGHD